MLNNNEDPTKELSPSFPWEKYIWDHRCVFATDLRLVPQTLKSDDRDFYLKTRFKWLVDTYGEKPSEVYETWQKPEGSLLEERLKYACRLSEFQNVSTSLPVVLAKLEVENLRYYHSLYWCLKVLQARAGLPVIVVGPTFGGEVEVASFVGAKAYLLGRSQSRWMSAASERLLHTGVEFENFSDSSRPRKDSIAIVVSPWVPNPAGAIKAAYNSLGDFGFVIFPSGTISLVAEAERLGMTRKFTKLPDLCAYYKDIGQDIQTGDLSDV